MRILLTGGSGKLGREIKRLNNQHMMYAPTHKEMDITKPEETGYVIESFKPNLIIHCAALTSVVKAENNWRLAWKTNVEGTNNIIHSAYCKVVYVSTACVFKGTTGNNSEEDVPNPCNFYGLTKLVGESIVRYSSLPSYLIVRTNFVARGRWPYPKAFTDRYGTWLYSDQVAEHILQLIDGEKEGLIHVCSKKKRSMYELAHEDPVNKDVKPYTLEEYYREHPSTKLTLDMSLISIRGMKCCG